MTPTAQAPGAAGKGPRDALRMELGRAGAPVPPSVERHVPLDGARFRQYPGSSTRGRRPAVRGDLHFSVHSVGAQYALTRAHLCLYIRAPWQKPEIPSAAGSKVLPKAPASLLQHSPCL